MMRYPLTSLAVVIVLAVCAFGGVQRVFRPERFVRGDENVRTVQPIDDAAWIWEKAPPKWAVGCIGPGARKRRDVFEPRFLRFRKAFTATDAPLRLDVSADERFVLLLDGKEIARGPHRGMPERWFYQSYEIGLEAGDNILSLNGRPIDSHNTFLFEMGRLSDQLAVAKTHEDSMKVRTVMLGFQGAQRDTTMQVVLTEDLKLGFMAPALSSLYKPYTREYGFFESIPAGIKYGWNVLAGYVDDMKYVFSAEGAKSLGGFGAIGSLFPPMWDWYMFWKMTAFLSIILAFMNILPIPALDGGHVLFLMYEAITRRKPSEQFMIRAEYVGFGILILLMVVANLNDILRWLGYM